jgi:hypothetical protein
MMKIDTHATMIVKIEDRLHTYYCANNSNLGEIYDALNEMRAYILQRMHESDQKKTEVQQPEVKQ